MDALGLIEKAMKGKATKFVTIAFTAKGEFQVAMQQPGGNHAYRVSIHGRLSDAIEGALTPPTTRRAVPADDLPDDVRSLV